MLAHTRKGAMAQAVAAANDSVQRRFNRRHVCGVDLVGDAIGLGQIMGVGARLRRAKLPHGGGRWAIRRASPPLGGSVFVLCRETRMYTRSRPLQHLRLPLSLPSNECDFYRCVKSQISMFNLPDESKKRAALQRLCRAFGHLQIKDLSEDLSQNLSGSPSSVHLRRRRRSPKRPAFGFEGVRLAAL